MKKLKSLSIIKKILFITLMLTIIPTQQTKADMSQIKDIITNENLPEGTYKITDGDEIYTIKVENNKYQIKQDNSNNSYVLKKEQDNEICEITKENNSKDSKDKLLFIIRIFLLSLFFLLLLFLTELFFLNN